MLKMLQFVAIFLMLAAVTQVAHADLLLDCVPADVAPREDRVAFVPRITHAPVLDGKLDEPLWQQAGISKRWVDRLTGASGDIDATMRVIRGVDAIYFGFTLRGLDGLNFKQPKGGDEYGGSVLELFFDPNNNKRTKVQIVTNPLGLRYDAYDYRTKDFTGTWKSESTLENDTWTAEISIPFAEMNNQSKRPFWNANFCLTLNGGNAGMFSWTGGWGDPDTDYGILFFGDRATYESTLRTRAELLLDRMVYDVRDVAAKALLSIESVGTILDQLSITVRTQTDSRIIAEQTIAPLPATDVSMTIDLTTLAIGDYTLHVDVNHGDRIVTSVERAFSKQDRGVESPAVTTGRIPLRVHAQPQVAGMRWPISTGVPFSPGSLTSTDHVRLIDPAGNEVPCQLSVRSTWSPHGPIRWLGVDFIPTLAADQQTYTLEYGPSIRRSKTGQLKVAETDNAILVDTGPLQFTVDRNQFNLIASAALNGKPVLASSPAGGLSLVDHEGNRYRAALDRDVEVTVEDAGSVRATICAKGWYVREGSDGSATSVELPTDRLCLFTVRLTAASGSAIIKAAVSTTITYDTTQVRLRELTIGLPVASGSDVRVGNLPLKDQGYLLQDHWDRSVDAAGKEHPRIEGWIETPTMRVAMRRFWQLFPKEIGYADGMLTLHPWPAHGREVFSTDEQTDITNIYKLRYAHQGRELDFTFPDTYFKALDEMYTTGPLASYKKHTYYKRMRIANAQGLNIHNDLLISFSPEHDGDSLAQLVNTDPHAIVDSEYACATGVFGPLLHADEDYADLEETFTHGFSHLTTRTTRDGKEYGQFIFGNTHNHWNYATKSANMHRVWQNNHYQNARLPFVQYLRTGDPIWMDWGRDQANTVRDIAMVHYISAQRSFAYHQLGAMYHCKGFAPWAGDAHVAAHPATYDFLLYDYYLYGNRRSLDAVQDWIKGIKISNPGGYATREGMTTLAELTEAYRYTWDAALIELMHRFREAIHRKPFETSQSWDFHPLLLTRDWNFFGDQRMVDAYRRIIDMFPGGSSHFGNLHYFGFYAMHDKDPARLSGTDSLTYNIAHSRVERPELPDGNLTLRAWIRYAYQVHKLPYLLKAMKHYGIKPAQAESYNPMQLPSSGKTAHVAVKETSDRLFKVNITPLRATNAMPLKVIRDDGKQIVTTEIPATAKGKKPETVTIDVPADGRAAEYHVVLNNYKPDDGVYWPITDLTHEVALAPAGQMMNVHGRRLTNYISDGARVYLAAPQSERHLDIDVFAKFGVSVKLFDCNDTPIGHASGSRYVGPRDILTVPADANGPLSMYYSADLALRWADIRSPLIIGLNPEALFEPSDVVLIDE